MPGLVEQLTVPKTVFLRARLSGLSRTTGKRAREAFAGPDYQKAVYYPEDEKFLLKLNPHVVHYEVLVSPSH
jgi:hypothetical protein